jgi:hypothetical protein
MTDFYISSTVGQYWMKNKLFLEHLIIDRHRNKKIEN